MNFDRTFKSVGGLKPFHRLTPVYSSFLGQAWQSRGFQWLVLVAVTVLSVAPRVFRTGTNVVTETYRQAAEMFLNGQIPYGMALPNADRFEYSPLFCVLYTPFSFLSPPWQALGWTIFNSVFFWAGVLCWCHLKRPLAWYTVVGFVLCAMELNISLLYQQTNAFLIGLSLIALALFREKFFLVSAILLTIATNLKPIPAIFALPLLFFIDRQFWRGLILGSLFCLLLPALFVGMNQNLELHLAWIKALFGTLTKTGSPQIDIASFLSRQGLPTLGTTLRYAILILGLGTLIGNIWTWRFQWPHWITLACTTILLVSPRSESPTFVFLAACFPLLTLRDSEGRLSASHLTVLILSGILITVVYTDLWPRNFLPFLKTAYFSKPLGTLLLWIYALGVSAIDLVRLPAGRSLYVGHRESY